MKNIKWKILTLITLLLFSVFNIHAQISELSRSDLVKLDFKILEQNKVQLLAKNPSLMPAYDQLIKDANKSLKFKAVSVMDKVDVPPSGSKHDYMSVAPYWWPDSSKKSGLPYKRKDGEVNPEVKNYPDKQHLPMLCEHVYNLSLAYYFSDNELYAEHASNLLKVWFLDSSTAMNPNLNFGQAIKGVTTGRAEGLIDARHFIYLLDGVKILKHSKSFSDSELRSLKKWMKQFLIWMETSRIGLDELNAKNNHGVWFDATSLAIANFIDDQAKAKNIILRAVDRLDVQMDDSGFFPLELARTTSLHYSTFILDAFTIIAQLSKDTDTNLWDIKTKTQKSLEKGYSAILPYWLDKEKWQHQQIRPFIKNNSFQCLWRASDKFNCKDCKDIVLKSTRDSKTLLINLL